MKQIIILAALLAILILSFSSIFDAVDRVTKTQNQNIERTFDDILFGKGAK